MAKTESKSKREIKRITSVKEVKGSKISRTNALDLMQNSRGSFFTAVVTKKDNSKRSINGQYIKGQKANPLGYVKVREVAKKAIRHVNLQTIQELRIGGKTFKVR